MDIQKKALEIQEQKGEIGRLNGDDYRLADAVLDSRAEMSSGKKRLLALEKEGKYVFHGSAHFIDVLEPRQAHNNGEKDGQTAVFATPYADVAIFRSLTGGLTSRFGIGEDKLQYSVDGKLYKDADKKIGRVYVLDREKFKDFKGTECRSYEDVFPLEVIEVGIGDLSDDVKIMSTEKYKIEPEEIERNGKYFKRKEKRHAFLDKFESLKSMELLKAIKQIVARRLKKQEVLREPHQVLMEQMSNEYNQKFELILDGDYTSTEERQKLYAQLVQQAAYYELNPKADWTETDGEVQEREFSRGVEMQKILRVNGLCEAEVVGGNIDADMTDLEVAYKKKPKKLEKFNQAEAEKFVDFLFNLQTRVDRKEVIEVMKEKFGCQETIFILEDYFDSWEGYKDNTNAILENWDEADEFIENFKTKAEIVIAASKSTLDKYQQWDEAYLINGDCNLDNLSEGAMPINWSRVGVTNNFLNVLIYDYGQLRANALETGRSEFVTFLDEIILNKFRELGDEAAGKMVIKLATLRSMSEVASGLDENSNDDYRERVKQELLKALSWG